MSAKRQSLKNEESYAALEALFLKLSQGGCEQAESDRIWRQVVADPWYRAEVRVQASRLVGRCHLDEQWCDDLAQDVVVILKAKLSNDCGLGADAEKLNGHFPAWMGRIIRNACIDALKHEAPSVHACLIEEPPIDETRETDLRLDMIAAAEELEHLQKMSVLMNLQGFTIKETAQVLGVKAWRVQVALAKGKRHVIKRLAPYIDDIRQRSAQGRN